MFQPFHAYYFLYQSKCLISTFVKTKLLPYIINKNIRIFYKAILIEAAKHQQIGILNFSKYEWYSRARHNSTRLFQNRHPGVTIRTKTSDIVEIFVTVHTSKHT